MDSNQGNKKAYFAFDLDKRQVVHIGDFENPEEADKVTNGTSMFATGDLDQWREMAAMNVTLRDDRQDGDNQAFSIEVTDADEIVVSPVDDEDIAWSGAFINDDGSETELTPDEIEALLNAATPQDIVGRKEPINLIHFKPDENKFVDVGTYTAFDEALLASYDHNGIVLDSNELKVVVEAFEFVLIMNPANDDIVRIVFEEGVFTTHPVSEAMAQKWHDGAEHNYDVVTVGPKALTNNRTH